MDRYVIREPRSNQGYVHGQNVMRYPPEQQTRMGPEMMYYQDNYQENSNVHQVNMKTGYPRVVHANNPFPTGINARPIAMRNQVMPGIEPPSPAYPSGNPYAAPTTGDSHMYYHQMTETNQNYYDSNVYETNRYTPYQHQAMPPTTPRIYVQMPTQNVTPATLQAKPPIETNNQYSQNWQASTPATPGNKPGSISSNITKPFEQNSTVQTPMMIRNSNISSATKNNEHVGIMTRAEKLKVLHKSGTRVFSGPVEKVLKWNKALHDIGLLVIYEIVAKCVSISQGDSRSKHLVIRDDNGPAIQVVYYEIDFLLPELKPPCTVRIVGKMMTGSARFQAYNVRAANGDDVATLPRRAAVANHHVGKLCKEFSNNQM